jgi:hypothetical protein
VLEVGIQETVRLGASLLNSSRLEPFGAEAWLPDPEDNRLLVLVR